MNQQELHKSRMMMLFDFQNTELFLEILSIVEEAMLRNGQLFVKTKMGGYAEQVVLR